MPRRPSNKQVDIDVVPYLSIMVIVLKLICLILVVTVMRIALNPHGVKAVAIENVFGMERKVEKAKKSEQAIIKAPTYMDCGPLGVTIYPGNTLVTSGSFSDPTNLLFTTLDHVVANSTSEYVIVLVRPGSVRTYRYLRKLLASRQIDVGYDVFDTDVKIDFKKSAKASGIELKE